MAYFSIVIPVYQAQRYIRGMLDSIKAQTFTDFEVILVHDKGTDKSLEICRRYEEQDDRFHVLDLPKNKGASGARNEGIKRATGQSAIGVGVCIPAEKSGGLCGIWGGGGAPGRGRHIRVRYCEMS